MILQSHTADDKDHKPTYPRRPFLLRRYPTSIANTNDTASQVGCTFRDFESWNEAIEPVRQALRDPAFDHIVLRARETPIEQDGSAAELMSAKALAQRYVNDELLQSMNIKKALGHCENSEAARVMLSYPGIELESVSTGVHIERTARSRQEEALFSEYIPIAWFCENSGTVLPVLPLCNSSEELFSDADKFSRERFDIVLAVANALCVAAGAGWPHRRLGTDHIFIHKDLARKAASVSAGSNASIQNSHEKDNVSNNKNSTHNENRHYTGGEYADGASRDSHEDRDSDESKNYNKNTNENRNKSIEHLIKIVGFRCPVTFGCVDGCATCKRLFTFERDVHGRDYVIKQYHQTSSESILFADTFDTEEKVIKEGENCDAVAFASFVLWLYSGICIPPHTGGRDNGRVFRIADSHLSRVPWPIRYIVNDALADPTGANQISLSSTVGYLNMLRESAFKPHQLNVEFMPPISPLFPVGLHASLSAARSDEPQAMIRLGQMCKRIALSHFEDASLVTGGATDNQKGGQQNKGQRVSRHVMNMAHTAYGLYAAAARNGEVNGFMNMANMLAMWLGGEIAHPLGNVVQLRIGKQQLFRCVLRVALEGESMDMKDAVSILKRVSWNEKKKEQYHSVQMVMQADYSDDDDDEHRSTDDKNTVGSTDKNDLAPGSEIHPIEPYMESKFHNEARTINPMHITMTVVVSVAKSWRRGAYVLPCDISEAWRWLELVIAQSPKNSAPRGAAELELGLILRQMAMDEGNMHRAVDLVRSACGCVDVSVRSNALFWMGLWNHTKLTFTRRREGEKDYEEEIVIVEKDNVAAAHMFKESAESDAPVNDAIAYYSKFLKLGIGGVERDLEQSTKWNKKARKAGSVMAMVQYAYTLQEDAKLVFDAIPKSTVTTNTRGRYLTNPYKKSHVTGTVEARHITKATMSTRASTSSSSGSTDDGGTLSSVKLETPVQVKSSNSVVSMKLSHGTEFFEDEEQMRDMVDLKMRRIRRVLIDGISKLQNSDGEQSLNPFGYWTWGHLLEISLGMWTACATEVRATNGRGAWTDKQRAAFVQQRRHEVLEAMRTAAGMDKNKRWREHRVNYVHRDRYWIDMARAKVLEMQKS